MDDRQPANMKCLTCGAPVRHVNPAAWKIGKGRYCSVGCRKPAIAHGHNVGGQSPTYKTWHGMRQRCGNPLHRNYALYGGRGIRVCDAWETFAGFLTDMGERPSGTTLDRIDVDGDYTPQNCRWISHKRQMNNMRKTCWITYQGEEMSLQELADRLHIDRYTLRRRILDMKWPQERWAEPPQVRKQPS